jgi:hypothetical protein
MYALAASAAGASLLTFTQTADAKIVYTPAHVKMGANSTHFLDLNHDGIKDFAFVNNFSWLSTFEYAGTLGIQPIRQSNEIAAYSNYSARAFAAGAKIGPGKQFRQVSPFLAQMWFTLCTGKWCNVKDRYLGLKFVVKGKTHFGWARLNVSFGSNGVAGLLTGYAYETIPNKPIIAGKTKGPDDVGEIGQTSSLSVTEPIRKTASLGLLALGSPGRSIWRREDSWHDRW